MSSWVTSRHSLGPMVWPTSALSSSIPFTVVGVLMRRSISAAAVPGVRSQGVAQRPRSALEHRLPVRDEDRTEGEVKQRLEGRVEPLSVETPRLRIHLVGSPDPQHPIHLDDRVAEDERVVARQMERHLVAARLAYRVRGHAARKLRARLDLAEAAPRL